MVYDYRTDEWYNKGRLRDNLTGKLRGYPGLVNTAWQIAEYVPRTKIYCEPFAGLGRLTKYIKSERIILNDKSDHAVSELRKKFSSPVEVFQMDFMECMKQFDSPETFFVIDPPWSQTMYEMNITFCDRTPSVYYKQVFEMVQELKGNWIVCMNHTRKSPSGGDIRYFEKKIISPRKIMGYQIKVKCVSNLPFVVRNQIGMKLMEF